ncbi:MAG: hypothetical protein ABR915_02090 [Thermoguttaceae bacterium]|jgi:hypothetical protein
MKRNLMETLRGIGKPTDLCLAPDGSSILVLPHGGRILGLFAPGSEENFLWTHPALASPATAREFYAGDQWHNSGGDRTWLAPEVDFFLPNFPALDKYRQPRQLDPGNYQLDASGAELRLTSRLEHVLSRSRQKVELEISKSVGPAANPLRYETGVDLAGIDYAGYTLRSSLRWLGGDGASSAVGLWNLLQMPHGGELLVPTHVATRPKVCFGTLVGDDIAVGERLVRYRMRASGEQKIAVRAVAVTGRAGYRYRARDGRWALVVRNFFVDPSGQYVDVPWSDAADLGYAVQACNVNSGLGRFSELEYHAPAIGPSLGRLAADDVSQVWAFRGTREQIAAVSGNLLTADW